jgi:uncharacterized protein YraI
MKANVLIVIAFLCSGAAFAQQASVKATVNVNSQAGAGNSSVGTATAGSAIVKIFQVLDKLRCPL